MCGLTRIYKDLYGLVRIDGVLWGFDCRALAPTAVAAMAVATLFLLFVFAIVLREEICGWLLVQICPKRATWSVRNFVNFQKYASPNGFSLRRRKIHDAGKARLRFLSV